MNRLRVLRPLRLAALALGVASSLQGATVELRPGILVDTEAGRAYLMCPEGGVEAISLDSGRVLFASPSGTRPLAVAGGWLVTLAEPKGPGSLDLALISLAEPTRVSTLSSPLPPDVRAMTVDGLGRSFEVIARSRGAVLDLAWTARWQRTSPIPPGKGEPQSGRTQGGLRLDLASLNARTVPHEEAASRSDGPVPATLESLTRARSPFGPPVKAGGTWSVVETIRLDRSRVRLVLQRVSREGTPLAARTLFEGDARIQIPSADSRHVLVGALDKRDPARFTWALFSLESGEPAGVLSSSYSHAPFSVLSGGNVAYEARAETGVRGTVVVEARRGLVVARPDGSVVFRRDVRENEFRGPFPP